MRIENNKSPYFGAKFINDVSVSKLYNWTYKPVKASFVEYDPNNSRDLAALKNLSDNWNDYDHNFAARIYERAKGKVNSRRFFVTRQSKNLDNLNPQEILGVAEVTTTDGGFIDYIQVKPNCTVERFIPKYKGVGTSILTSLKKMYDKLQLISTEKKLARNFYENNEFMEYPSGSNFFVWYRNFMDSVL